MRSAALGENGIPERGSKQSPANVKLANRAVETWRRLAHDEICGSAVCSDRSNSCAFHQFSRATARSLMLSGGSRHVTSTGEKLQSEGVTLSKPDVTPCSVRCAASPTAVSVTISLRHSNQSVAPCRRRSSQNGPPRVSHPKAARRSLSASCPRVCGSGTPGIAITVRNWRWQCTSRPKRRAAARMAIRRASASRNARRSGNCP